MVKMMSPRTTGGVVGRGENVEFIGRKFNPDSAIGIVDQQNFSTILGAHGLFWIEGIASYFEIQNGSKYLRLKKNEVE
jgi:hypothetical protein